MTRRKSSQGGSDSTQTIRILIVDDRKSDLISIAEKTRKLSEALHPEAKFEIELTQNAHWAASKISKGNSDSPWALILSDVFMPLPYQYDVELPEDTYQLTEENGFPFWANDSYTGYDTPDHGGYRIADAIISRLANQPEWTPPRMALISSFVKDDSGSREKLASLLQRSSCWLDYFDKAIEDDSDNNAKMRGFMWCLKNALTDFNSPRFGLPTTTSFGKNLRVIATSENSRRFINVLGYFTRNPGSCVLIEGESGTGKLFAAMAMVQQNYEFPNEEPEIISCRILSRRDPDQKSRLEQQLASADRRILLVVGIQHLQPALLDFLIIVLEEKLLAMGDASARPWQPRLTILTETRTPEGEFASRSQVERYGEIKRVISPRLQDRKEDLQEFFLVAREASNHPYKTTLRLSESARIALENHHWEGNLAEFFHMMSEVLRDHQEPVIEETDLPENYRRKEANNLNAGILPTVNITKKASNYPPPIEATIHEPATESSEPIKVGIHCSSFRITVCNSEPISLNRVAYLLLLALKWENDSKSEDSCQQYPLAQKMVEQEKLLLEESWYKKLKSSRVDLTAREDTYNIGLKELRKKLGQAGAKAKTLLDLLPVSQSLYTPSNEKNTHWGFKKKKVELVIYS